MESDEVGGNISAGHGGWREVGAGDADGDGSKGDGVRAGVEVGRDGSGNFIPVCSR